MPLQPRWVLHSGHIADCGEKVEVRYQRVGNLAACKSSWSAHNQIDADAVVGEITFHGWESYAMIGSGDD